MPVLIASLGDAETEETPHRHRDRLQERRHPRHDARTRHRCDADGGHVLPGPDLEILLEAQDGKGNVVGEPRPGAT